MNIQESTLGEAWLAYMAAVLRAGTEIPDDREPIVEGEPVCVRVSSVSKDDPVIVEFGDAHVVELYVRKMFSMEIIPELNSTYGSRIFDNCGIDQFDWLMKRLKRKWWTKAATISLLQPNDPGPRIPCLTQIQFAVRNNRLQMHAVFRSQNVYRCYGNFLGLAALQEVAAKELSMPSGDITSYCVSPHIYRSDLANAHRILRGEQPLDGEAAAVCFLELEGV